MHSAGVDHQCGHVGLGKNMENSVIHQHNISNMFISSLNFGLKTLFSGVGGGV